MAATMNVQTTRNAFQWKAPINVVSDSYTLYRDVVTDDTKIQELKNNGIDAKKELTKISNIKNTDYTDSNVNTYLDYEYWVTASNKTGESSPSNKIKTTATTSSEILLITPNKIVVEKVDVAVSVEQITGSGTNPVRDADVTLKSMGGAVILYAKTDKNGNAHLYVPKFRTPGTFDLEVFNKFGVPQIQKKPIHIPDLDFVKYKVIWRV